MSAVVAGRATVILLGLLRNLSASFLISGGMVAEKKSVWRKGGRRPAIFSTSGMKPISSMRSASSITSTLQSASKILPRSNRSIIRPGVAISTSTPRSSAACWSLNDSPPINSAWVRRVFAPYLMKFSATCWASSRVGSRISDRGMRALARPLAKMSIMGRVKLAVLPVPVCAQPSTSRPIRTMGIACFWIGVGVV